MTFLYEHIKKLTPPRGFLAKNECQKITTENIKHKKNYALQSQLRNKTR